MAIRKPLASIKSLSQSGSKSIFNPWCRETRETAYCCEPPLQSALIDKFHLPGKERDFFELNDSLLEFQNGRPFWQQQFSAAFFRNSEYYF
ncbi:hypothetical protein CDAR_429661 [Caerostris darwini]|uniref:Uncharacterized protein n=1 Tax=Caerostris darwini TaxID=1538125 RepID=A0AAV4VU27_9ARAC|nr:hypothetical protein CDAR_429661 [Caerostris darwini]